MPIPTGDALAVLAGNLSRRGSVLPIPTRAATRWTRGLDLPRGGSTVLYTGLMYQLVPYIERLVANQQRLADSPLARLSGLARRMNRVVNITAFLGRPSAAERAAYDRVPADVAGLLRTAGVEFGCLYGDDLYSGALAHDLGLDDAVAVQARRVHAVFQRYGVREVITIDPHTTMMLRTVYPRLLDGYTVRVRSYLEVLADRAPEVRTPLSGEVAIHDPCVYARREGVLEQPRDLLGRAGIAVREPADAGRYTWCCGGPAESLHPDRALATAQARAAQLRAVASDAVTLCPLCLVNLRKGAGEPRTIQDISTYLRRAYAPRNQ